VDDERIVLVALKEQLQRELGARVFVETADDGESALEILEETLADGGAVPVVVTDHIMPGIQGDELVARIKAISPTTRNVMLTGQASADAVGSAVNSGGLYRFLSKPWDRNDLVLTVREAFRSFNDERELEAQRATVRDVHAAALDLTANLAAADRYVRLLERLVSIVGAEHAALLRLDEGAWLPLAVTPEHAGRAEAPPAEAVQAWSLSVEGREPVRTASAAGARWLWGVDVCASSLLVPLQIDGRSVGLIVLGACGATAFTHLDDARLQAAAALAAASLHTAELVDALEESNAHRQRVAQELVRQANGMLASVLTGASPAARVLRRDITSVLQADPRSRVLIVGSPGSGREAVARSIHAESDRSERPFLPVTCAMLRSPDELVARAELARGATLYLHGIEHLSEQADRQLRRVLTGGRLDARLIASTGAGLGSARPLREEQRAWYAHQTIQVPSLRERSEDTVEMAELLLRVHGTRAGRGALTFSSASKERMCAYAWPGNVRELSSVIERVVLTSPADVLDIDEALLESGRSLGNYTLIEELGAGGMGEVWRARHKHLARPAAVKLIQAGTRALDTEAIQRFRREAEATARLRSPHTVELYDFGVTDESGFYYVMELLHGLDLQQLVRQHGPMPPERVVHLLSQALRSLIEAHEAGMVHRDIKPANLFVCRLGANYDFVKLLDFGLVTALDVADESITQENTFAGTPSFMAPEHGAGEELDGRADLYSVGCVAHWMLTGEPLFKTEGVAATILAHFLRPADPPSERLGHPLPEGLDAWVLSLLGKTPDDRPPSTREALKRLLEIELPSPWTPDRAERWWAEHEGSLARRSTVASVAPTQRAKPRQG